MKGSNGAEVLVGILAVSHSPRIAAGVVELVREVADPDLPIAGVGGTAEGLLGNDAMAVVEAIERIDTGAGVVVVVDIGSAVYATRTALEILGPERAERIRLSGGPLVEGALVAVIQASTGADLDEVVAAANGAGQLDKLAR